MALCAPFRPRNLTQKGPQSDLQNKKRVATIMLANWGNRARKASDKHSSYELKTITYWSKSVNHNTITLTDKHKSTYRFLYRLMLAVYQ